ncbi:DUF3558 family protein [Amycolatopsis sp.]|uniref:DUF3558 family protein n=1 Tax=Amycolatopsis sp. TaxID=37632 RepID=UPI002B583FFA|nr:DUF3558 family protein [Amycolatopsis sp.]HVV13601.1 DUF3558 family protein [Amycolatopsis sp.]
MTMRSKLSAECRSEFMSIRRVKTNVLLVASVVGVLSLAGCSNEQQGNASPATSASGSSAASGGESAQPTGDAQLAELKACELLTTQEAALFNAQGPGQDQNTEASGATSSCHWTGRSADDSSTTAGINIRATQGVDSVNPDGGQLTAGKLNTRPAVKLVDNSGGYCMLALGVTATSRVDVGYLIVGATDATEACDMTNKIANIVEPKLPKYEG